MTLQDLKEKGCSKGNGKLSVENTYKNSFPYKTLDKLQILTSLIFFLWEETYIIDNNEMA